MMVQLSLDSINEQHEALLSKRAEMTEADVPQVEAFVQNIAEAGVRIIDPEQRSFLRSLIDYWSTFINNKKGEFPITQLKPFVPLRESGSLTTQRVQQVSEQAAQQAAKAAIEQVQQAAQQEPMPASEQAQQVTEQVAQQAAEQAAQGVTEAETEQVRQVAEQEAQQAAEQAAQRVTGAATE